MKNKKNEKRGGSRDLTLALMGAAICVLAAVIIGVIIYEAGGFSKSEERLDIQTALTSEASPQARADAREPISAETPAEITSETEKVVVVLDPGHGKLSNLMTDGEKEQNGWQYADNRGWGEWRHWKSGTVWEDCFAEGCSGRAPENGSCWYPIENGDRETEPAVNLNNALAAKRYLEEKGFEVRLTRADNETNPSMTRRLTYCCPNGDTSLPPDADLFVCVHSNAGGGRGSCYISLDGVYDQAGISGTYADDSNTLGRYINDEIVNATDLSYYADGVYTLSPELVLFCKSPITIAYLEIGFFDNDSDLSILESESDAIGKAIADGIGKYVSDYGIQ